MSGHSNFHLRRGILTQLILCAIFSQSLCTEEVSKVTYFSVLKLEHTSSNSRLHSHSVTYGTGSEQQSVTGMPGAGDSNSLWILKPGFEISSVPAAYTVVRCGDVIRLQHLKTGKNLHSHLHRAPMNGDNEVSAFAATEHDEEHGHGAFKDGDTGDNWVVHCERTADGEPWLRGKRVYFRHVDTQHYLTATNSLRYSDPIPNQLHVSARSRRNSDCFWKAAEGVFYAPKEEKKEME